MTQCWNGVECLDGGPDYLIGPCLPELCPVAGVPMCIGPEEWARRKTQRQRAESRRRAHRIPRPR